MKLYQYKYLSLSQALQIYGNVIHIRYNFSLTDYHLLDILIILLQILVN